MAIRQLIWRRLRHDKVAVAALLAQPSGVLVTGDSLQAQTPPGHGLVFATEALEEVTH
jgi:hypothetical protein